MAPSLPIAELALVPGGGGWWGGGLRRSAGSGKGHSLGRYHQTRPFFSGGEVVSFYGGLERDHPRWLDPGDHRERLLASFRSSSSSLPMPDRDASSSSGSQTHITVDRGPVPLKQGSHRGGGPWGWGVGVWGNSTPTTSWRPRKRVGFCPILNFRGLNPYLLVEKFRLETMTSILRDLCPGMWMVSLSKGCVLSCTYSSFSPQFPEVRIEGPVWGPPRLPVGSSPLWPSHSPSTVYQVAGSSILAYQSHMRASTQGSGSIGCNTHLCVINFLIW